MSKIKKSERVKIRVNNSAISEKTVKTKELIKLVEATKELISELTDGNVADSSIEAIDAYLNEKTSFLNGRMSAMAFNREGLYDKVVSLLPKLDSLKEYAQYIKKGGVNEAKIEEDSTMYLAEKYTEDYLKLKELIDAINELESAYVVQNALTLTRSGLLLEPQKYQAIKVMAHR